MEKNGERDDQMKMGSGSKKSKRVEAKRIKSCSERVEKNAGWSGHSNERRWRGGMSIKEKKKDEREWDLKFGVG